MTIGPQKLPTSLSRIRSQTKQVLREMAETGHTPGPWHLYANTVRPENMKGQDVRADCDHYGRVCKDATLADATLIAAAPELLQALQRYFTEDWSERYDEMESMFNSAIQSATGTAP